MMEGDSTSSDDAAGDGAVNAAMRSSLSRAAEASEAAKPDCRGYLSLGKSRGWE